jgi:hypothetical protein
MRLVMDGAHRTPRYTTRNKPIRHGLGCWLFLKNRWGDPGAILSDSILGMLDADYTTMEHSRRLVERKSS